ncbi:hypothetical protein PVK06_018261 [Gossypium arboreum]|uniref:NB-ARC domain-containing protein n=1 Tax=Gossypium arboreum TaxID=29729 RepID=A0ABR0Q4Y2_GOSAR|nr:hypothetical protein PVK06_018261 [Gossypium arboreum]
MSQGATSKGKKPRLQPISLMDGAVEYVGRANEKKEMLDIKESFDHKSWVCVADDFDAVNITQTILRSLDADSRDENDLNLLQVKLKEKLSGKRFLLVLDDIWNEKGCAELVDDCSSPAKEVSSLQTLSLSNISKFNIPADRTMLRFGNSEHFEIHGWEELASLSQHGLSLVGHRFIFVWRCPRLHSLEADEAELQPNKISRVESLNIASCDRLNRLPQVLHDLTFLTVMKIGNCRGLVSFAENNLPPNLKKLKIEDCENLEYLVDEKEDNKSTSSTLCLLEDLEIFDCPSLIVPFVRHRSIHESAFVAVASLWTTQANTQTTGVKTFKPGPI